MIEISSRHALAIAILVALATVPGFVHRGTRFLHEDCRDPEALLRVDDAGGGSTPPVPEELRRLPRTRVAARRLQLPGDDGYLDLYLVQAFNPALAYKPTELYFFERATADRRRVELLEHEGQMLPVHLAYYHQGTVGARMAVAGYLAVFDAKPVANAYLAELVAGPRQLLSGRKPFWVFFARGEVKRSSRETAERALHEALASAWEEYRAACLP